MRTLIGACILLVLIGCSGSRTNAERSAAGWHIDTSEEIVPVGTFPACHASTIVEKAPGEFLAAWFAGSYEGAADVTIRVSASRGRAWTAPVSLPVAVDAAGQNVPCWNPVLTRTANGTILLFYKAGPNPREWWGMVVRSYDGGKHWSEPQRLPEGFLGPVKNKPVWLPDGSLLCPSSTESAEGDWSVHMERTDSSLTQWRRSDVPKESGTGVIQPSIIEHADGRLQLLCRSNRNSVLSSWSSDTAAHWTRLSEAALPNPNSGIDAVTLTDGSFLIVYNPLEAGKEWFNGRNVLSVARSSNGERWERILDLVNETNGEFSYPAIIQSGDGSVHITYTADRKTIRHIVLHEY